MIAFDGVEIGPGARPFVVAEAGVNFRDDIDLAKAFVEAAADNGADAVKFQTHVQSEEMVESEMRDLDLGGLYDRMGVYELSMAQHRELKAHCEDHGVTFLSTPFSVAGVERKKPATHYLERAMSAIDADPERTLMVGDSDADLRAARRAGVDSAFLRRAHRAEHDPSVAPTHELSTLHDLRRLVGPPAD